MAQINFYKDIPLPSFEKARKKAANFIIDNFICQINENSNSKSNDKLAVLSIKDGKYKTSIAKLGAAGLALVAFSSFQQQIINLDKLRKIGNFIIFMQKSCGNFVSRYNLKTGKDESWYSLYYPGEACLGLIELFKITKDLKYIKAAQRGLLALAKNRENILIKDILHDHWALIATARLFESQINISKDNFIKLIEHSKKIMRAMISTQIKDLETPKYIGSFHIKGELCPTSTRLEAIQAIYPYIKDQDLKNKVDKSIKLAIDLLLRTQIKDGFCKGGWPRAISKLVEKEKIFDREKWMSFFDSFKKPSDMESDKTFQTIANEIERFKNKGSVSKWVKKGENKNGLCVCKNCSDKQTQIINKFNNRVGEIRIDYVQHALCALIMYKNLRENDII